MFKEMFKPALILMLICLVITAALAVVNGTTKPIIEEGNRQAKQEALSKVYEGASDFSDPMDAETLKSKGLNPSDRIVGVYEVRKDGEVIGYVADVATRGYGGDISMLVAIDKSLAIKNTIIVSHSETPGFGSKVKDGFMNQFNGQIPENGYNVVKKAKTKAGDIEAITGATITSRAATNGVSDAVAIVRAIIEGGI